jgi:hypothetical protein
MNQSPCRRSSFFALLIAMTMGGVGAGCGEGAEPVSDKTSALSSCVPGGSSHTTGWFGLSTGTVDGFGCQSSTNTPITFINLYSSSQYIYGIELVWGSAGSKFYGKNNGLNAQPGDFQDDPVYQIKTCVNSSGMLTGIQFRSVSGVTVVQGGQLCGNSNQTLFHDIDDVFTNLKTSSNNSNIVGAKFIYTGP